MKGPGVKTQQGFTRHGSDVSELGRWKCKKKNKKGGEGGREKSEWSQREQGFTDRSEKGAKNNSKI